MRIFTENIVRGKYRIYSENLINEASFAERRAASKGGSVKPESNNNDVSSEPKKSSGGLSFAERRAASKGGDKVTAPQKSSEPVVSSSPKKSPGGLSFAERRAASKGGSAKPELNDNASEPVVSSSPKKSSSSTSFSERRAASKGEKNTAPQKSSEHVVSSAPKKKSSGGLSFAERRAASKGEKITPKELSDDSSVQEEPKEQEIDNTSKGKLKRYLDRRKKELEDKEEENKEKISVDSKEELQDEILRIAQENPNKTDIDLNCLDVSDISDFSYLFSRYYGEHVTPNNQKMKGSGKESKILQKLNPKIESWDVSLAKTTDFMFAFSKFNGDISQWYFGDNWESADSMFMSSDFSGKNLNNNSGIMDISNLKVASYMFSNCKKLNADFTSMKKPKVIDFENDDTYRGNFDSMFSNSPSATPPEWINNLIIDKDY